MKKYTLVEKQSFKEAFHRMSPAEKVDYIFTYYKIPLVLGILALVIMISGLYRLVTRREVQLYSGLVNVEAGSQLDDRLTDGFLEASDLPVRKNMVQMYRGLYLTDDPASEVFQYVYASRLKILASIESHQLDLVLMNREAYDTFSQSGYLLPLDSYFQEADGLVTNLVIYEDNAEEHAMDESIPYEAVTGQEANGLDCSDFTFYKEAGFTDPLYLGIIANTPRLETAIRYLQYLQ